MPEPFREAIWARRPQRASEATECLEGNCSCPCSLRTTEREKQLFCEEVLRPTAEQGLDFFAAASAVLRTGILLISDVHRPGQHTWHTLHDFGTQDYGWSMVLYGLTNNRGKGHYEAIGLFPSIDDGNGHGRISQRIPTRCLCNSIGCWRTSSTGHRSATQTRRWISCASTGRSPIQATRWLHLVPQRG